MSHALVIIASQDLHLTQALVGEILAPLPRAHRSDVQWLSEGEACEVTVLPWDGGGDAKNWASEEDLCAYITEDVITPGHAKWAVDIALVPHKNRQKKLLVADMESTIIEQELIDELARNSGLGNEIADITTRAMRGELDFAEALRARVAYFAGLDASHLDHVFETTVTYMPGAETLIKTMAQVGAKTALVSGGFTIFTDRIASELGFDHAHGNTLEIVDGRITGQVLTPIIDRDGKASTLRTLAASYGFAMDETMAVGDGANDLDMIQASGLGVAFRAKPVVAETADVAIHHGDLTALLYLQGVSRDQFVA